MNDHLRKAKLIVLLGLLIGGAFAGYSFEYQVRTKRENMTEMNEVFTALNTRMMEGAITTRFTDQDFEQVGLLCDRLAGLATEYAKMEPSEDLSAIATGMTASARYLKQQAAMKDPLVLVMTYGRLLSFCAECHYQTRWAGGASTRASRQEDESNSFE
jgi:thymidine kinase